MTLIVLDYQNGRTDIYHGLSVTGVEKFLELKGYSLENIHYIYLEDDSRIRHIDPPKPRKPSLRMRLAWAKNTFLVKHTPRRVLDKFEKGEYQDFMTKDDPRPKGWMKWRRVNRLINRCLECGFYIKSHQDLNTDPLGETYIEAYNAIRGWK